METVTIELGDGASITVYKPLLHKTMRDLQTYQKPFIKDGKVDETQIDDEKVSNIFIKNQGVSWSFGEIRDISEVPMTQQQYEILGTELTRLYKPTPLVKN